MSQVSHGVGPLPAGEGVGAEPGVDDAEVRLEAGPRQVQEILPQLARVELALVHHRRGGQRADVEPEPEVSTNFQGISFHNIRE